MTTENATPSFWQWIAKFLKFTLRMVFVLVLAVGLGSGIYFGAAYGIPALYRQYIQPVEDNTLRLDNLESQREQDIQQVNEQIESLKNRVTSLETQNDTTENTIADLQTQLTTAESVQATQRAVLATLEPQSAILMETQSSFDEIQRTLDRFRATIDAYTQRMEASELDQEALTNLQHEIAIIRVMEVVTRARLFLVQGNLTQAEMNIQTGVDLLTELNANLSSPQQAAIAQSITHLEDALDALPESPVSAADQLDGAWQLLLRGIPELTTFSQTPTRTALPPPTTPTPTPND